MNRRYTDFCLLRAQRVEAAKSMWPIALPVGAIEQKPAAGRSSEDAP